jgi:HEAT repeat protein
MRHSAFLNHRIVSVTCAMLLLGAATALGLYLTKDDPVGELSRQLASENARERYKAAKGLEELGPAAIAAIDSLVVALDDPERDVRYRSVKALSRMAEYADQAIPALTEAVQDSDPEIRYYSAKTLAKAGKAALPARDAMLATLPTSEQKTQVYLLKSLGKVGKEHDATVATIRRMRDHKDLKIRNAAREALEDLLD